MAVMSKREYDKCIDRLEKRFDLIGMPLIKVERRKKSNGADDTSMITIMPIWAINGKYFRTKFKKSLEGAQCAGGRVHDMQGESARHAPKEDPSQEDLSLKNPPLLPLQFEEHGDDDLFMEIMGIRLKKVEFNDLIEKLGSEAELVSKIEHIKANSSCNIKNWYKTILTWKIPLPKKEERSTGDFAFCELVEASLVSDDFIFQFNHDCAMINATTSQMPPIVTPLGIEGFQEILKRKLKEKGFKRKASI
jgi:hypothetical protein